MVSQNPNIKKYLVFPLYIDSSQHCFFLSVYSIQYSNEMYECSFHSVMVFFQDDFKWKKHKYTLTLAHTQHIRTNIYSPKHRTLVYFFMQCWCLFPSYFPLYLQIDWRFVSTKQSSKLSLRCLCMGELCCFHFSLYAATIRTDSMGDVEIINFMSICQNGCVQCTLVAE